MIVDLTNEPPHCDAMTDEGARFELRVIGQESSMPLAHKAATGPVDDETAGAWAEDLIERAQEEADDGEPGFRMAFVLVAVDADDRVVEQSKRLRLENNNTDLDFEGEYAPNAKGILGMLMQHNQQSQKAVVASAGMVTRLMADQIAAQSREIREHRQREEELRRKEREMALMESQIRMEEEKERAKTAVFQQLFSQLAPHVPGMAGAAMKYAGFDVPAPPQVQSAQAPAPAPTSAPLPQVSPMPQFAPPPASVPPAPAPAPTAPEPPEWQKAGMEFFASLTDEQMETASGIFPEDVVEALGSHDYVRAWQIMPDAVAQRLVAELGPSLSMTQQMAFMGLSAKIQAELKARGLG